VQRDELLAILRTHFPELTQRYHLKSLSIFGSVARDEARPESDVDILVEFTEPVGLFEFVDLRYRLEDLLGKRVDLVTPGGLKRQLHDSVLREAIRAA
jgi:hypothetical protein